jgi:ATP synthase F1 delta subunit
MTAGVNGYAEALFRAALQLNCAQDVVDELLAAGEILGPADGYFYNPRVNANALSALLREALGGKFNPLTTEFILLLIRRRHLKKLPAIAERFKQLNDRHTGRAAVRLRVPFTPAPETLESLKSRLMRSGLVPEKYKDSIGFEVTIDKSVLGGFIAYFDGYQIDASVRTVLKILSLPERHGAK